MKLSLSYSNSFTQIVDTLYLHDKALPFMRKALLFVLLASLSSVPLGLKSQEKDIGNLSFRNRTVWPRINGLGIGAGFEWMIVEPLAFLAEGGVGLSPIMFPFRTIGGRQDFALFPYIKPSVRYYLNMDKRRKKGYYMQRPNAAYLALNGAYFFPIASNNNTTAYRVSLTIGAQSVISKWFYFDINAGPAFLSVNSDPRFGLDINVGLGMWF